MTKKTYRTAQGKTVDLGAIQLQNETVRAVGNMGVNARGDRVNSQNKTVDGRTSRVGKQYKKQISNVVDDYVPQTKHDQPKVLSKEEKRKVKEQSTNIEEKMQSEADLFTVKSVEAEPVTQDPTVEDASSAPIGGLADAIARARTVKQEPLKTPRQIAQSQSGVKKI